MSQKINPIIYRLGILKNWKLKFIETKKSEFIIYMFYYNEIKKFITYFFTNYNLILQDFNLFLNKNSIHCLLIVDTLKIKYTKIKNILKNQISKNFKFKTIKINNFNLIKFIKKKFLKKFNIIIWNKLKKLSTKIYLKTNIKRLKLIKYLNFIKNKNKNIKKLIINNYFLKKITYNLTYLFKNKINIFFTIKKLKQNNYYKYKTKNYKQKLIFNLIKINKFTNSKFFERSINFIYILLKINNKAYIISKLIEIELKKVQKIKIFNNFIKLLKQLFKHFLLKLKLINKLKIYFNGNISKKPRAITKIIKIGKNINNIKINSRINYWESTIQTKKGSIGIKTYIE
jgi:hypothetical protein